MRLDHTQQVQLSIPCNNREWDDSAAASFIQLLADAVHTRRLRTVATVRADFSTAAVRESVLRWRRHRDRRVLQRVPRGVDRSAGSASQRARDSTCSRSTSGVASRNRLGTRAARAVMAGSVLPVILQRRG